MVRCQGGHRWMPVLLLLGLSATVTWAVTVAGADDSPDAVVPARQRGPASGSGGLANCPDRCVCFSTTVRCMFLQLDRIPEVPRGTTTLDLRFNRIRHIPPGTFKDNTQLNTLLLNNNQISHVANHSFTGLSDLRYLYLYKNRIRTIEPAAFHGLNKLEQLYLHFNQIVHLDIGIFNDLKSLERLFLYNNKLSQIPYGAFRNMTSLRRLRLDSNALICDCRMMWLAKMLKDMQGTTQTAATCEYPNNLQGKSIAALEDSEFRCKSPVLMEEPNDVEISFGGTAYFTCKAEGDPKPNITWRYNGVDIVPGDDSDINRYTVLTDGTLMVENVQNGEQNGGGYECMAKNIAGEVKSRPAKMKRQTVAKETEAPQQATVVQPRFPVETPTRKARIENPIQLLPNRHQGQQTIDRAASSSASNRPRFIVTPRDQLVTKNNSIVFRCQASGLPPPTIEWTRNDVPITESERIQLSSGGTLLTINVAEREDSGTYRCMASNFLGHVAALAKATVQAPPSFSVEPVDQVLELGEEAVFNCRSSGDPTPAITWIGRGRVIQPNERIEISADSTRLLIRRVEKADETTYLCRAQNEAGTRDAGADLVLKTRGHPSFVQRPQNADVNVGDTVVFACDVSGNPSPTVSWFRDGERVTADARHRLEQDGRLTITEVASRDRGFYECRASNDLGTVTSTALLTVQGILSPNVATSTNDVIRESVETAKKAVSRALNDTLQRLLDINKRPQGPHDLMRLVRFPTSRVHDLVQSAEVYEYALTFMRERVRQGQEVNSSSDYTAVKQELSIENLELMANLSGCLKHRRIPDCSDPCFHEKYRTMDGTCNNRQNALWGASEVALRRILSPVYENDFNTPLGWTRDSYSDGSPLPSPRQVSSTVIVTRDITPDTRHSHMLMQWGQFLDHDLDLAPPTVSTNAFLDGADCRLTCLNTPPCFPISVPEGDRRIRTRRCMEFVRTSPVCGSGATAVLYGRVVRREQLNVLTSYIDASQVYGSSVEEGDHLRSKGGSSTSGTSDNADGGGLLRNGIVTGSGKSLLPFNDIWPVDCRRDPRESGVGCFLAGDIRVNEQLGLIAMHTVWFREHNRLAEALGRLNAQWDDERRYQEARKIVGAQMQHITYEHWLPKVLGPSGMAALGVYRGYDPTVEATISNAFATAALRFGHTLINPLLHRLDADLQPIPQGHIHLRNAFFSPFRIVEEGGVDPLLRGLVDTPTKLKRPAQMVNSELTEQLFRQVNAVALDLAAINIQRGRDHGLPSYTSYRRWCNLTVPSTFEEMRADIASDELRDKLKTLYGHPDNIDLWVGGVTEDVVEGAKIGPTFLCILVDQFRRLRDGDRFYYENPGIFSPEQLSEIKRSSLSRVLCDNGDSIQRITLDSFTVPSQQESGYVQCDSVPEIKLNPWIECCQGGCGKTSLLSRSRRDTSRFSYPQDHASNPGRTIFGNRAVNRTAERQIADDAETDLTEERVEGLESVVVQLERTVRRLTKRVTCQLQFSPPEKIHALEKKCESRKAEKGRVEGAHCVDEKGQGRVHGERWSSCKDSCVTCKCEDNLITCNVTPADAKSRG